MVTAKGINFRSNFVPSLACFCCHVSTPSVERGFSFDHLLPFLQANQASILE